MSLYQINYEDYSKIGRIIYNDCILLFKNIRWGVHEIELPKFNDVVDWSSFNNINNIKTLDNITHLEHQYYRAGREFIDILLELGILFRMNIINDFKMRYKAAQSKFNLNYDLILKGVKLIKNRDPILYKHCEIIMGADYGIEIEKIIRSLMK